MRWRPRFGDATRDFAGAVCPGEVEWWMSGRPAQYVGRECVDAV